MPMGGGGRSWRFRQEKFMERITQQKGFHSEEQWKIAKAIKDGFVSVQSEMWRHRGKLTCDIVESESRVPMHPYDVFF